MNIGNTTMTIQVEVSPQMYKYDDLTFHAAIKEVISNFEDVDPLQLAELLHYECHRLEAKAIQSAEYGRPIEEME